MTTTTARRISTLQWMRAELAVLTFGADHKGAAAGWHPIVEFGDEPATARGVAPVPSATPTAFIPPVRKPIAAIAATAFVPPVRKPIAAIAAMAEYQVDDLGPWRPKEHKIVPALLAHALAGGTR